MKRTPVAQGRHVRLVVRRVEPWTVLKFSVLLFATLYLVILIAGLVLWTAATATGLKENIEKFIGELVASEDFRILGPTMLRASLLGGMVLVVLGTGANVLLAVLYNLISDVIGGIAVVFEERPTRRRTRPPTNPNEPVQPLKPARAPRRRPAPDRPDTTPMPDPPKSQARPPVIEPVRATRPSN